MGIGGEPGWIMLGWPEKRNDGPSKTCGIFIMGVNACMLFFNLLRNFNKGGPSRGMNLFMLT